MSRYSWFRTAWPISMRELAAKFRDAQFTESSDEGYILERTRENFLEAAYIRRVIVTERRYDPFGRDVTVEDISYQHIRFRASSGPVGLEMTDSPRSTQRFVGKLLEICEFHLTVQPIQLNVQVWAKNIVNELGVPGFSDVAQIGGVALAGGAIAQLTVRAPGDVQPAVTQFLPMPHVVEKLQLRLGGDLKGSSVILGRLGTAKVVSREESRLVDVLRNTVVTSE